MILDTRKINFKEKEDFENEVYKLDSNIDRLGMCGRREYSYPIIISRGTLKKFYPDIKQFDVVMDSYPFLHKIIVV